MCPSHLSRVYTVPNIIISQIESCLIYMFSTSHEPTRNSLGQCLPNFTIKVLLDIIVICGCNILSYAGCLYMK